MGKINQPDSCAIDMSIEAVVEVYKKGLSELDAMVFAAEREVIFGSNNVSLVTDNINFFTKSFLISVCAHLEMCIKEIVFTVAVNIDARLYAAAVPASIIEWRFSPKRKGESGYGRCSSFTIGMTKKEVDDFVSGNVYKTKEALALVGVDLEGDRPKWESWKEIIQAIVTRRNNIVHHNDSASDIALGDVRRYIASVMEYIDFLVVACNSANK